MIERGFGGLNEFTQVFILLNTITNYSFFILKNSKLIMKEIRVLMISFNKISPHTNSHDTQSNQDFIRMDSQDI